VIDLYNVPDPHKYLNPLGSRNEEADISEPLVNYYNGDRQGRPNGIFNLDDEGDE
jgi:hypothetical protein